MRIELNAGDVIDFRGATEAEYWKLVSAIEKQGFDIPVQMEDFPPMDRAYFGYKHEDGVSREMACSYIELTSGYRGHLSCKAHISPESITRKTDGAREIRACDIIDSPSSRLREQLAICEGLEEVIRRMQLQAAGERDTLKSMLPDGMMLVGDEDDELWSKSWKEGDVLVARKEVELEGKIASKEMVVDRPLRGDGFVSVVYDNGTRGCIPVNHVKLSRKA